ncbi:peptidoglycan-associated lipoprotein Pal [Rickettsia endosymbiont of Cardiosporidium cionae]|uniref:peptidoglycan-associated lipoprotein Pal n=1 Tax=Rickettsia endosymbiont of Cardiosporidium cionae TaxID=2777155 RepID=UPI001892DE0B|nr:peptidoglycan-associated lipoprotein Pal [Rickettsia endosymbiont of Cardiosporidium cionae]KAF8818899.1 Peptidoglycan-associated lipoprotein [Rickettsia endosymbiont of Cardiosporidium cionae]
MFQKFLLFIVFIVLASCKNGNIEDKNNTGLESYSYDINSDSNKEYVEEKSRLGDFALEVEDRVFFTFDSSDISQDAQKILLSQIKWILENNVNNISIAGHCDERGTREYNIALGEKRAEAVKVFLINNGLSNITINTVSYGKERPAVIGNDEASWMYNRRAVTSIVRDCN